MVGFLIVSSHWWTSTREGPSIIQRLLCFDLNSRVFFFPLVWCCVDIIVIFCEVSVYSSGVYYLYTACCNSICNTALQWQLLLRIFLSFSFQFSMPKLCFVRLRGRVWACARACVWNCCFAITFMLLLFKKNCWTINNKTITKMFWCSFKRLIGLLPDFQKLRLKTWTQA